MKKRNRVISTILGIGMSVMMIGANVQAASSYKVVYGDGGVYTIGSGKGYTLKVEASSDELKGISVDGTSITDYTVNNSSNVTTSEAPATTSEAPATTSEAPATTSEAPVTTSEAPPERTPEAPEASAGAMSYSSTKKSKGIVSSVASLLKSILNPKSVQAADVDTITVTIASSYMDKLSLGEHTLVLNFADGKAEATVTVQDSDSKSEAATTVDTGNKTDKTTSNNKTGNKTDKTTSSNSKTQNNAPKTGDNAGIFGFSMLAALSGAAIFVLGKKKVIK